MSFATPNMLDNGQLNEFTTAAPAQPFSQASEVKFNSATKNNILALGASTSQGMGATRRFVTAKYNYLDVIWMGGLVVYT